jgi:energy-coupling factor transporter ATP-binding protein EcfA2
VLRAAGATGDEAQETSYRALERVGLADLVDHLVEELSGGQQQRVAVARAIAGGPAILIADEPTAEQDEATRAVVLDQLFAVPEHGGALVLATHDPDVASRCARQLHIGSGAMPPPAAADEVEAEAAPQPAHDDEYEARAARHHEWMARWPRRTANVYASPDRGPYTCPCCYFRTLRERGGYDNCPVCGWEDDGQDDHDADVVRSGPNAELSLTAARANFGAFGACDQAHRVTVRPARPEER